MVDKLGSQQSQDLLRKHLNQAEEHYRRTRVQDFVTAVVLGFVLSIFLVFVWFGVFRSVAVDVAVAQGTSSTGAFDWFSWNALVYRAVPTTASLYYSIRAYRKKKFWTG